ncbi:hypothetical protein [Amnibacterium kyonggiense]|uniref:MFS transporter permease n=1 Tax=Amnibacterium kyonggiense TaxID=595671 RepID=A0A4R7FMI8_9MICO|nr:hypothetical protein [Amnibacterium kyonggiense]TDS77677.1 hypothetical protein CLV52_2636 [Amnibacterium kyonggiense]
MRTVPIGRGPRLDAENLLHHRRPRAVWAAFITSTVLVVIAVVGVLLPILGFIGAAVAATAGVLRVPVGGIVGAIAIGYVLALVLLVFCVRRTNGAAAWVLGVAAVISALAVSVWPIVAVALSGVAQVQDVEPFIQELIARVLNR